MTCILRPVGGRNITVLQYVNWRLNGYPVASGWLATAQVAISGCGALGALPGGD